MAQLIFNIPDEQVPRVVEAISNRLRYDPESGITRVQFVKEYIRDLIIRNVLAYEAEVAAEAARNATPPDVTDQNK